ncbi:MULTISPECIES: ABC transporter permease [Selenomonas]|uniref:ABC transporter permease n=1 Tax=Selenomonas ruminis TaxID=2593411 RepID=A0A5D6VVX9_9FIRM|nr:MULTISPECIES: ABC transporter permease [unclassified Selenomonas]MBQ1868477.1 ABC transporter permease [Selenomonas sp.]TYZ19720.1 ABC transporter permease [Selenomonas sp. mPRGC5]
MRNSKQVLRSYALGALFLLLLWWGVALLVELPIIPTPDKVLAKLGHVFVHAIAIHSAYSLWRIAAGLGLAVLIGYPLGLAMGYCKKADRFLAPLVYLTYPIPKIALLPILMLLAGVGEWSKILMIFLIIVFQVVIALRDGIRAIPEETYYPLYSLGASFWQLFRHVIFPASLPKFLTAIRVAMATAISVLFFTETFGTQYGMGYYIMDAWLRVNYLEMYAGIVVLSLLGLLLFGILDLLEYMTCRWQK